MRIAVVGTGYVGLVTGAVLAELGSHVVCVDSNVDKVSALRRGEVPIHEPGLPALIASGTRANQLHFTTCMADAVADADVVFLCVGTPPQPDGSPDLSAIRTAAAEVGSALTGFTVIVNKSTVPVGTASLVSRIVADHAPGEAEFEVVSNPEFLREGSAVADCLNPDRVVIGAPSTRGAMKLVELYMPLARPILVTDVASAEITKYAANAFLATKISFINSIAQLCEAAGGDITQVARGIGMDARIGHGFLQAGLGYGGSCFPKDTLALIHTAGSYGCDTSILKAVVGVNSKQPDRFLDLASAQIDGFNGKTIGVLGLAFKPDTDDIREAVAIPMVTRLLEAGAKVNAYDPIAMEHCKKLMPPSSSLRYSQTANEVAVGADALLVVTEWREFRDLNWAEMARSMNSPTLFDGRNLLDPSVARAAGFNYFGVGRRAVRDEEPSSDTSRTVLK